MESKKSENLQSNTKKQFRRGKKLIVDDSKVQSSKQFLQLSA